MCGRKQIAPLQLLLHARESLIVGAGGDAGLRLGHQMRVLLIAGLGQVRLVDDLYPVSFGAVARVGGIG